MARTRSAIAPDALAAHHPSPGTPDLGEPVSGFLGTEPSHLIVARPPAREALYHRFENELFDELITRLNSQTGTKIILVPRSDAQRADFAARQLANVVMPREALDGANLIAAADLVVSAGGTMNREAAALGVPAISVYAGKWAAIDEELIREGRLQRISSHDEVEKLSVGKKPAPNARRKLSVRGEVVRLILE